jgi:hypothetical protein
MDMLAREVDAIRAKKAAADQRSVLMKVNVSLAALLLRLREKRKGGLYDFGLFARIVRELFAVGQDIRSFYGQLVKGRQIRRVLYIQHAQNAVEREVERVHAPVDLYAVRPRVVYVVHRPKPTR